MSSTPSATGPDPAGPRPTNPFPGLRPFKESEEHLFFGRESQIDAMVDKLAATRFLAVVGTSGSGKSSLVNCGLRPALHAGLMAEAGTSWRMAKLRPGSDPLGALARAVSREGVLFEEDPAEGLPLVEIVETNLRMSRLGLVDVYEQAHLGEETKLLVVVDQFEELFRFRQLGADGAEHPVGPSEEASAFVNLLLEAARQEKCPIYLVLTMRSDFLGECTHFPGLAEAINVGQYLVPRMTRRERRAAIREPVMVGGAEISPVLLTRLVNDVGDNPDQLSILQHALNRTWAHWEKNGAKGPLDLEHYEAIGTMERALDNHAEEAYRELHTTREQTLCRKIFQALTDKGTDPRGIRRPTTLADLCALAAAHEAEIKKIIEVFREPSRSFLMPPAEEALEPKSVIDISHETLLRVWKRLRDWADEEARSAAFYRTLREDAKLHAKNKKSLWRTPELESGLSWMKNERPTEAWAARYGSGFPQAIGFLEKSRKADRRNKLRRRLAQLALVALVVLGLAALAVNQKRKKDQVQAKLTRLLENNPTLRQEAGDLRNEIDKASWEVLKIQNDIQFLTEARIPERKRELERLQREIAQAGIRLAEQARELFNLAVQGRELALEVAYLADQKAKAVQSIRQAKAKNRELRNILLTLKFRLPPKREYAVRSAEFLRANPPSTLAAYASMPLLAEARAPEWPAASPAKVDRLEFEEKLLNMRIEELHRFQSELEADKRTLQAEKEKLTRESEAIEGKIELLEPQIRNANTRLQALEKELQEARRKNDENFHKKLSLDSEIAALNSFISYLEEENQDLQKFVLRARGAER